MAKTIQTYLTGREADALEIRDKCLAALELLQDAGRQADDLLIRAQTTRANETQANAGVLEAVVQTLGGMSRVVWAAAENAEEAARAVLRLAELETALRTYCERQAADRP